MAKILDGREVRDRLKGELIFRVKKLKAPPVLAVIQVGSLAASSLFIAQKTKFGEAIGVKVNHINLPGQVTFADLQNEILKLNKDVAVRGIIVQLPLPPHLDVWSVIETIDPKKDVDGLTAINLKKLWRSLPYGRQSKGDGIIPATACGVLSILDYYQIPIEGKRVVVVGRSNLVGGPIALTMLGRGATITICHRKTLNLAEVTKSADILISAAGSPGLITKNHVSPGQTVIDVGLTPKADGVLFGDVEQNEVAKIVSAITPVPGGVGPMTVCSLFLNLLDAAENN